MHHFKRSACSMQTNVGLLVKTIWLYIVWLCVHSEYIVLVATISQCHSVFNASLITWSLCELTSWLVNLLTGWPTFMLFIVIHACSNLDIFTLLSEWKLCEFYLWILWCNTAMIQWSFEKISWTLHAQPWAQRFLRSTRTTFPTWPSMRFWDWRYNVIKKFWLILLGWLLHTDSMRLDFSGTNFL